jgi:hypothetical protein
MTAREFLIKERGILPETLDRFGVAEAEGWLRFPYPNERFKERLHDAEGRRKFRISGGTITGFFGESLLTGEGPIFLVEGESDTLRLDQELRKNDVASSVVGLSGINTWKPEFSSKLDAADVVFVVLDNDDDYKVQATVDRTWIAIRKALGRKAQRIYLPDDVKDLCEFFDKYNVDTLRMLAERGKEEGMWHYKALDLMVDPGPPDWLVNELICKGDLTMMIGEPGVGKSWLTMSLAVAIAEGYSTWLGRPLAVESGAGRVLYVDEENPQNLIPYRLQRLGLTDDGAKNIRYLHRQGVRLDKHPELLLDEALDFEPTLIVLDSLTRLHTKDENSASEVAALFNDGINPLCRDTGATTIVLHHTTKSDGASSFTRARGSGDMSASIDSGLDVRDAGDNSQISIKHYKSRWIGEGQVIRAEIEDTDDGGVVIATREPRVVF